MAKSGDGFLTCGGDNYRVEKNPVIEIRISDLGKLWEVLKHVNHLSLRLESIHLALLVLPIHTYGPRARGTALKKDGWQKLTFLQLKRQHHRKGVRLLLSVASSAGAVECRALPSSGMVEINYQPNARNPRRSLSGRDGPSADEFTVRRRCVDKPST